MNAEVSYVDGNVFIQIKDESGNLLATFNAEHEDGEYRFASQTPYTGQTIIHTDDSYNHIASWRKWPVRT